MFCIGVKLMLPPVKPLRSTGLQVDCALSGAVNKVRKVAIVSARFISGFRGDGRQVHGRLAALEDH